MLLNLLLKIVVIVVKIITFVLKSVVHVFVTVSFLNLFLPLHVVLHCYLDSLSACLGIHMLRIRCVMAMFATKDVLWIPPSNSFSNPIKATMDPRVRRVQIAIQGP